MLEILDVFIDIFRVVSPTMIVQLDNFTLNNFNKIILTDFRFVPDHHFEDFQSKSCLPIVNTLSNVFYLMSAAICFYHNVFLLI